MVTTVATAASPYFYLRSSPLILDNPLEYFDATSSSPPPDGANDTDPSGHAWLQSTLANIRVSFLPIIVAGTITNCLNFIVLSHHEMRTLSTAVYLLALAVADLGVMYFELFRVWFEWTQFVDPRLYFNDTYCRLVNYANGVTRDYSNWLIACVTLERLAMIACPYRARDMCTPEMAKRITIGLLIVICIPHIHSLFYSRAQLNIWWVCWEDPNSLTARVLGATVEFFVGYIVIIVVFVLNVFLSYLIYSNRIPSSAPSSSANLTSCNRKSHNRRLTRTLLLVAFLFLVCETPRLLMSPIVKFIDRTATRRIILNISFALSGINHAANFFIYIVSSPRFRQLLIESLRPSIETLTRCLHRCCESSPPSPTLPPSSSWKRRLRHRLGCDDERETARSAGYWCCCRRHGNNKDEHPHEIVIQFNLDVYVGSTDRLSN